MQAIHAAQRFVERMNKARLTAPQLTKVDRLLMDLNAVRWDDASPDEREAGWELTLRPTLLKHARPDRPAQPLRRQRERAKQQRRPLV